jgi:hypothetical protein
MLILFAVKATHAAPTTIQMQNLSDIEQKLNLFDARLVLTVCDIRHRQCVLSAATKWWIAGCVT